MAGVKHGPPSLSKSALLLSPCIYWAGPQALWFDESKVEPEDCQKRDDGTTFHAYIADAVSNPESRTYAKQWRRDILTWFEHGITFLDEHLLPRCAQVLVECAIGVHWESGKVRLLGEVKNREYPNLGPGWQYGTADLVAVLLDGSLLIADWKTGGTDGAEEQLLSLACAFQKALLATDDLDVGNGKLVPYSRKVRISCLQVNENGVWPHEREVSDAELEAHWDAMRFQWEDLGKASRGPKPGIHCTTLYCPHLAYCDAVTDVAAEAARQGREGGEPMVRAQDLVRGRRPTDTPANDDEAGFTMAMTSAAQRQLNYWKEAMKAYVKSGGRVIQGNYEWSDGPNGFRWRKRGN